MEDKKSRQVATFEMGLGSSFLEKVVIPYANSPSTNPSAKVVVFLNNPKITKTEIPGQARDEGEGMPGRSRA